MLVSLVAVKLILLLSLGQFGSLLSFFGFHNLGKILAVCAISAALALASDRPRWV